MYEAWIHVRKVGLSARVSVNPLLDEDNAEWQLFPTAEKAETAALAVLDLIPEGVREGQEIEVEVVPV